jgi:hypothetical protein
MLPWCQCPRNGWRKLLIIPFADSGRTRYSTAWLGLAGFECQAEHLSSRKGDSPAKSVLRPRQSQVLDSMPADSGLAFVVVLHLDPRHRSELASLLGRGTAMPVESRAGEQLVASVGATSVGRNARTARIRSASTEATRLSFTSFRTRNTPACGSTPERLRQRSEPMFRAIADTQATSSEVPGDSQLRRTLRGSDLMPRAQELIPLDLV